MKKFAIALLACLFLAGATGCSWLCCDPCEGVKPASKK